MVSILSEAGASVVLTDVDNADALAVSAAKTRSSCQVAPFLPSDSTRHLGPCPVPPLQNQLLGPSCPCETLVLLDERCAVADVLLAKQLASKQLFSVRDEAMKRMAEAGDKAGDARCWSPPEVMYIMYTSGSTGKPKGCIVPTSGVWHRFGWGTKLLGFSSSDVFVLKTPSTFDCSIPEMWVPMYVGCTSVVVPDGAHLDFEVVKSTMSRARVTVAHFVPSVLSLFLDFVGEGDLPALRQISCTGEALLLSHREKLTKKLGARSSGPLPLINLYGPTEAAIEVTYFDAKDDTPGAAHGFPIGFGGDDGVHMYVTDPNDPSKLMGAGEKGEVCIGGVQVAYGYLDRPELTNEKFVPNPHGHPGLLYRSGDLGTMSADGLLQYHGRADRQVKVGGVRIELGEIEAVTLKCFPSLLNVAVEKVDQRLVGVAAPRPGATLPSAYEVQAALATEVPAAYIPSEWHFRDSLPLGSAGKVDHKLVLAWVKDQSKASMWGAIYDELYFANEFQVSDGVDDPTMDWAAYTDSFTNEMHERPTIQEWVEETVNEVLAKQPKRVVEMGCGKGMILFKVASAPCVEEYVGCDLSRLAVKHVERVFQSHVATEASGVSCKLSTHVRDASNFAGLADKGFDAVVCNGVSMYFPSASYLVDVLLAGLPKLEPSGGVYHFGDVISREHYKLFLLRRARFFTHSYEELQSGETREQLFASAKDRCFEHELFYALQLAGRLPGVAAIEVQLKHGEVMSEFNRYRYNVLLHLGESPSKPLDVVDVDEADEAIRTSADAVASKLASLAATSPNAVLACHGILNARLSADALLLSGAEDAVAPPVQLGVGAGGGIDPPVLRAAVQKALPGHHLVLQWARDGRAERMDVYAIPLPKQDAEPYPVSASAGTSADAALAAGLDAVMRSACAVSGAASLIERAEGAKVESFTNQLQTVDEGKESGGGDNEAALNEAKKLWNDSLAKEGKHAAVLALLGAKLGLPAPASATESFSSLGGNSFVAMQTIGAVRSLLGVAVPVFELLTKTFGAFADSVVAKASGGGGGGTYEWVSVVDESTQWGKVASLSAPTFVFFPQAGSSPKQYAPIFTELKQRLFGRYLFIQPPGRDARADEPNETDYKRFISQSVAALKPYLIGPESREGPTTFIGDSWGAIAAFAVAHELRKCCGWTPSHMLVSGNASPRVTSTHMGLGSYSPTPMQDLTDKELVGFLKASGVEEEDDSRLDELVQSFRADCQLYEDYKRPEELPMLPTKLCVLRGKNDQVVTMGEACGWVEEFDCEESKILRVPNATHHVHEEQPAEVAEHIIAFLGLSSSCRRTEVTDKSPAASPTKGKHGSFSLAPPCPFVRGVDEAALQSFREGNLLYRMGSALGSKGEISQLSRTRSSQSKLNFEYPPRENTTSPEVAF